MSCKQTGLAWKRRLRMGAWRELIIAYIWFIPQPLCPKWASSFLCCFVSFYLNTYIKTTTYGLFNPQRPTCLWIGPPTSTRARGPTFEDEVASSVARAGCKCIRLRNYWQCVSARPCVCVCVCGAREGERVSVCVCVFSLPAWLTRLSVLPPPPPPFPSRSACLLSIVHNFLYWKYCGLFLIIRTSIYINIS